MKNGLTWALWGLGIIIVTVLMTDRWAPDGGIVYNIGRGTIDLPGFPGVPSRLPVMIGVVFILRAVYLKFKNSN